MYVIKYLHFYCTEQFIRKEKFSPVWNCGQLFGNYFAMLHDQ